MSDEDGPRGGAAAWLVAVLLGVSVVLFLVLAVMS